jgi:hypothetical protein
MGLGEALIILFILGGVTLLALIVIPTLLLGISPMPTSPRVRQVVLSLVKENTTGVIHELGAAWGSLAFPLATHCPLAKVVAWEASPVPWLFLKLRQVVQRRPNLEVRLGSYLKGDLSDARLVVCYLWTGGMAALAPKLLAEVPDGAEVVSHTFAFHGWKEEQVVRAPDLYRTPVYRYVIRRAPPAP